jgi:predicted AAA+ superfamily ATPase
MKIIFWFFMVNSFLCFVINRDDIAKLTLKAGWAPAIAILGPRQCGKTTLAKAFGASQSNGFIYLDLESPTDKAKLTDAEAYFKLNENKLVIIDEAQLMPEIFSVLRSVIDSNRRNGRFLLLGSASPNLVHGVTESLAGRISFLELGPLKFQEITNSGYDWRAHWLKGGFPQAFLTENSLAWADWMAAFIKTYTERDFRLLFGLNLNSITIAKLWQMLAYNQGNIWKAEMYANSLGVSAPTANRYFEFLEGAFLVHRLQAFTANTNKRMVKAPKVYVKDSGIVHYVNRITDNDTLQSHPIIGASWEGYVIQQIYASRPEGMDMYYYRTQNGAEVDVVLVKANQPVACIEIKLSNAPTVSRGFYNCIEDLGTTKNYVITPSSDTYPIKNIWVCSLEDFLKKYLGEV